MMSIWQQAIVVFHKNFTIYYQERQYRQEFFVALLVFVILLVGSKNIQHILFRGNFKFYSPLSWSRIFTYDSLDQFKVKWNCIFISLYIVTSMISEKSDRQKEIQKIMGLKQSAYQLGWFLFNFARIMAVSFFFLVLALPTGCFGPQDEIIIVDNETVTIHYFNPIQTIGSYLLYAMGLTAQQYFLTTLFDQPKNGADVSMLLNIFGSVCSALLSIPYFQTHSWIVHFIIKKLINFICNLIEFILITCNCIWHCVSNIPV